MKIMTLKARLVGTSPLLMHNPAGSMQQPGMKSPSKRIPKPEEEAEAGTYRDENGCLVFPSIAIRSAMLYAAIGYKIGRRSASSVLAGAIITVGSADGDPEWLPVTDADGTPLTAYAIDTRRAVVQRNGVLRSRPRLNEWCMDVAVSYDADFVAEEQLVEVLERAGIISGLGDFRPQRKGEFGRFMVEREQFLNMT